MSKAKAGKAAKSKPISIGEMALLCVRASPLVVRPFLVLTAVSSLEDLHYSGILFLDADRDRYEWLRRNLFMLPQKQIPLAFMANIREGSEEGQLRRRT